MRIGVFLITNDQFCFQIICLSATTNKLSNIQQQAKEYATLIMEELDPEETGFIMNNVTSLAKTIAGSTPLKQNQRHKSSARIIRSILSNKEMRQSQSARPQSEQAVPTSDLQKERQPLCPVHVQWILK
ncbi:hypothetical protein S83_059633 [Arachis hypogaea]